MNIFQRIPASKKSIAFRKPVCGVGINDADYITRLQIDKKRYPCPYYEKWVGMLRRCYGKKQRPNYKGCTVCVEWFLFSCFRKWMDTQDWQEKELDKDLLVQGNKIYSPSTCLFVSQEINTLLTDHRRGRGKYPQGVGFNKGKYRARCNIDGSSIFIGHFCTIDKAHEAYKSFKYSVIKKVALEQADPLRSSLLAYKIT